MGVICQCKMQEAISNGLLNKICGSSSLKHWHYIRQGIDSGQCRDTMLELKYGDGLEEMSIKEHSMFKEMLLIE